MTDHKAEWVLVPRALLDRFPEINPANYDRADVEELNAWGVEVVTTAAPAASVGEDGPSYRTCRCNTGFVHQEKDCPAAQAGEREDGAKFGRNSAFWGERLWTVFTLRYSRGYVVQTDIGDDSRVFNTMGEVNAAIKASGWEIVR
jgi:hypothetical protein